MSESVDITNAIRAAVAHERAASGHADKYEQQMKSAGANMFHAFVLSAKGAPEHAGRKLDDKALLRLYKSTARRTWWDASLAAARLTDAAGKADRGHAKRLIQWYVDLEGARRARAQHAASCVAQRKKVDKQQVAAARSSRETTKAPTTAEMRELRDAAVMREAADQGIFAADVSVTVEDLLGECSRLQSAVKKVDQAHRADALEILKVTAREIERHVS